MSYTYNRGVSRGLSRTSIIALALGFALTLVLSVFSFVGATSHTTDCVFTTSGSTMNLEADCTTDGTIGVPEGMTLDGNGHTITAVDPDGDQFRGAVVANDGDVANVTNVTVTADSLTNACKAGADRLRGIMFDGAEGSITNVDVIGINKGQSGCQEGNAIEVRNEPFDGEHPDTKVVEISHNYIADYQKTGILANGDVEVSITHNHVGESATQENLAANSIQVGFGAYGTVMHNHIDGNQWKGTTNWGATAILVFDSSEVEISKNNISGNSDVGIYLQGDNNIADNNKIFDVGDDHQNASSDYGLINFGTDNSVTKNKVKGFENPYYGVDGGKNITIPGPNDPSSIVF